MSSTLTWEPTERNKEFLDDRLKFIMQKSYGSPVNSTLTGADIPYLQGLLDAGVKDAEILLDAINKWHTITVKEEF